MNDLISRQAAIEAIESHIRTFAEPYKLTRDEEVMNYAFEVAASCVYNLPTTQERKRGHWIYKGKRGRFPVCECSVCGNAENADWAILGENVNYCPNCGAEMKGEDDDKKRS